MKKNDNAIKLLMMLAVVLALVAGCGGVGSADSSATDQIPDIPASYSISGRVSGDIQQGVNVAVSGAMSVNVPTDPDGNYSVSGLPNGSYTITPSKAGYTFTQASRAVAISGAGSSGNDFTSAAVLYAVSGTVSGAVTGDVTITVTGTTEGGAVFALVETTTSNDGNYSVPAVPNGDYTVAAAKPGYLFNPASYTVTIAAENSQNRDFSASINPMLAFTADGGAGSTGAGGNGGQFYAESNGSIKVLKSGNVDAVFPEPSTTADFGAYQFTVSTDTTVTGTDDAPGALCQVFGQDGSLYIGDGNGICGNDLDTRVTGLTVAAGATLVLVDNIYLHGMLNLENDLVIQGTITSDLSVNSGLYIEANFIYVESTGKITASATTADEPGGEIYLGQGQELTKTIINRGTIEARGYGSGFGGHIYFEPDDLVVNYGMIDVSGGGRGGLFEAYVDHGDFFSTGTVRMNGGNGGNGGEGFIQTVVVDNTTGRNGGIIIGGTWEATGGDGTSEAGGSGGNMSFQTQGMGAVTVNASMTVKGGNATAEASWGGSAGQINFISSLNGFVDNPTPGKISIAGTYDLCGGDGHIDGGSGGTLYVYSDGVNSFGVGSDVEFVAFPVIAMNGGQGGENIFNASGGAFELRTYSSSESSPAKSITNEADVLAKGGDSTITGGTGGYVGIQTDSPGDAETVLNNSGNIDVSGGGGEMGAMGGNVNMQARHVVNSGNLTANGGNGTTTGGDGGNITLTSEEGALPTTNTGTLSVNGGALDGGDGTISIDIDGGGPM
ncbi:MAG: carboxypeptidase-like regulatory domain-containing protein [Desulfosarcina sp.]